MQFYIILFIILFIYFTKIDNKNHIIKPNNNSISIPESFLAPPKQNEFSLDKKYLHIQTIPINTKNKIFSLQNNLNFPIYPNYLVDIWSQSNYIFQNIKITNINPITFNTPTDIDGTFSIGIYYDTNIIYHHNFHPQNNEQIIPFINNLNIINIKQNYKLPIKLNNLENKIISILFRSQFNSPNDKYIYSFGQKNNILFALGINDKQNELFINYTTYTFELRRISIPIHLSYYNFNHVTIIFQKFKTSVILNGNIIFETTLQTFIPENTNIFTAGGCHNDNNYLFQGQLSDLIIYNVHDNFINTIKNIYTLYHNYFINVNKNINQKIYDSTKALLCHYDSNSLFNDGIRNHIISSYQNILYTNKLHKASGIGFGSIIGNKENQLKFQDGLLNGFNEYTIIFIGSFSPNTNNTGLLLTAYQKNKHGSDTWFLGGYKNKYKYAYSDFNINKYTSNNKDIHIDIIRQNQSNTNSIHNNIFTKNNNGNYANFPRLGINPDFFDATAKGTKINSDFEISEIYIFNQYIEDTIIKKINKLLSQKYHIPYIFYENNKFNTDMPSAYLI